MKRKIVLSALAFAAGFLLYFSLLSFGYCPFPSAKIVASALFGFLLLMTVWLAVSPGKVKS